MIDATMNQRMQEATRLTRAGKLKEAMALLLGDGGGCKRQQAPKASSQPGNVYESTCQFVKEEVSSVKPEAESPSFGRNTRTQEAPDWRSKWTSFQGMAQPGHTPGRSEEAKPGAFTAGSFSNRAGARDYKIFLPSSYHGQAMPLVVMLHGCTQNPDDFAVGTHMNQLAEEQAFCVLYPAQPISANSSRCWNWFKASDQQRDGGEPEILAGMTREILDTHKLDATRVYVAGLSAGGAMATTLAMTYPELFAAVGVHSGLPHGVAKSLPDALAAMQGGAPGVKGQGSHPASSVPAIIFHGDRDTTVHLSNAERVAAQYAITQGKGDVDAGRVAGGHGYTRTVYRDAMGEARLEQWRIHGAGHAWAGGSSLGSYTDPKGPDASKEMLRFFMQHHH
ncbi:extracellular catalytic domain type 1 short-chain-length polyhydroxyalkanoate depolymerase [Vreelandella zhanjiangensis]|uniref:extracellular catalytic domain type 1 short-chain-length polyhydroxyalkanoate depolymerase n=1 Tax=Vreelandella zhanjiangensis TaxID=1121960 RepID=UPI0003A81664|nr:PHB depolymerase family esterase [Halomonas zhanjiangensis]